MAYGSTPPPTPAKKKAPSQAKALKTSSQALTDKQKKDLKNHMEKHKDLQDLSASQLKSHRMKMMSRMRKGMSLKAAHSDIMS